MPNRVNKYYCIYPHQSVEGKLAIKNVVFVLESIFLINCTSLYILPTIYYNVHNKDKFLYLVAKYKKEI